MATIGSRHAFCDVANPLLLAASKLAARSTATFENGRDGRKFMPPVVPAAIVSPAKG
jgi:hypothetical protein